MKELRADYRGVTLLARLQSPSIYACGALVVWSLAPGLRRIVDWRSSFSAISLLSILPLLALVPAAYILLFTSAREKVARRLSYIAWIWFGGMLYAYFVGIAAGNGIPATYTFAQFTLPAFFGLWLATTAESHDFVYHRIAKTLLAIAAVVSLYAFYQFVSPPPWDIAWMQRAKITSIGIPAAFEFRPFSTLNAPGPFADFLVAAIILSLPRMRSANWLRYLQLFACLGALGLTLARSDWIAFLVATVGYVALSPNKAKNLTLIGVVAVILGIAVANAPALLGNSRAGFDLQRRFDTLTNLETDSSYRERQRYFGDVLSDAASTPTGQGLGVVGTAAKLSSSEATVDFDNGYVARFTEMGYFGTACYLGALFAALIFSFSRWKSLGHGSSDGEDSIVAACIAVQVALLLLDISSDHHDQLGGLFFWLSLALIFTRSSAQSVARSSKTIAAFSA